MNSYLSKTHPENYQRAFSFKDLGYLMTSLCFEYYRKRDFLSIYVNETLGSYISNSAAHKTAEIGKKIFSNQENFELFEKGFRNIIEEATTYIAKAKELTSVEVGDFYDLQAMIVKIYYFFEKTEFFFTDECYQGEMTDILKKNLFILGDDLKMKSRPLLIEIISTILYHFVDLTAKQYDMSNEDIRFYDFEEVIRLLETKVGVSKDIVEERKRSFVLYSENGNIFPMMGDDMYSILERFKEKDYSTTTEFKGIIANKGNVVARVLVIIPELNIPYEAFVKKLSLINMNVGDILVTETTSPDFVPLMKRAGGIIANQGGMNSHAAIVSRELKIPCVIGTKIATQILKDGDLVEVDADNGVVKIL